MPFRIILAAVVFLPCLATAASAFQMKLASVATTGEVMVGTIHAKLNMTSTFDLAVQDSEVTCQGATDKKGTGKMTCSDGREYDIAIEGYGTFNGAYVAVYGEDRVAIGWGKKADQVYLQDLLAQ